MKYLQIYTELKAKIQSRKYRPGDALPGLIALAKSYKSSDKTVQKAMALLKSEGMVMGVPSQGIFVKEALETPKKTIPKKLKKVGILIHSELYLELFTPYMSQLYKYIGKELRSRGIQLYPFAIASKNSQEIVREINLMEIQAIFSFDLEDYEIKTSLESMGIPMIYLDNQDPDEKFPAVLANNLQGGRDVIKHFQRLGVSNVTYFSHNIKGKISYMIQKRWEGIKDISDQYENMRSHHYTVNLEEKGFEMKMLQYLKNNSAIGAFAFDGLAVFQAFKKCIHGKKGLKIPKHIMLFSVSKTPEYMGKTAVGFCSWSADSIAQLALDSLFNYKKLKQKVRYVPMVLGTNS